MEESAIFEGPPAGGGPLQQPQPMPPVPQLPPQMFTTAAQLLDLTDSKSAVITSMGCEVDE